MLPVTFGTSDKGLKTTVYQMLNYELQLLPIGINVVWKVGLPKERSLFAEGNGFRFSGGEAGHF